MSALEHLKSRDLKYELPKALSSLPAIYKIFFSNYKVGNELEMFDCPVIIKNGQEIKIRFQSSKEQNPFKSKGDRIIELSDDRILIAELEDYNKKLETWHSFGMIRIGATHGDLILLGIDDSNKDQLYLYGDSSSAINVDHIKIADNIFSLFRNLNLVADKYQLEDYNLKGTDLYRKWSEPFWRSYKIKSRELI